MIDEYTPDPSDQPACREYCQGRNFFMARGTESYGKKAHQEWLAMTDEGRAYWIGRAKLEAEYIESLPPELQEAVARDSMTRLLEENDARFRELMGWGDPEEGEGDGE